MAFAFSSLVVLLSCAPASGQSHEDIPQVAIDGFEALTGEGFEQAIGIWASTWTNEADLAARNQIQDGFSRLQTAYGPVRGYDIVGVGKLGARVRVVYSVLIHDRLPVYLRLIAYKAPDGWRVSSIIFNVMLEEVFPEGVLSGATHLLDRPSSGG